MKPYFIIDSLPHKADDVVTLLDANVAKPMFSRSNSDHWHDAIKSRSLTRVPAFGKNYRRYVDFNYNRDNEAVVRAKVIARGSDISSKIAWASSGKLGKPQLDHAIDGISFMTFEKSVVCILSLNSLIVEDLRKYEQEDTRLRDQLAAYEKASSSAGGSTSSELTGDEKKLHDQISRQLESIKNAADVIRQALIGEHSIIISCFYFHNIGPVVRAAMTPSGNMTPQSLFEKIATDTNQNSYFIRNILGDIETIDSSWKHRDRATKHVASYPTMRAIFKTLLTIDACKAVVGTTNREDYIQRLHVSIGNKTALGAEKMIHPQKITRPPYDWGPPEAGEEPYPPGFDDEPQPT